MDRKLRLLAYGAAGAALLIAAIAAPAAWATPGTNVRAQTVPTRTATSGPVEPTSPPPADTPVPTGAPQPTSQPGVTPGPTSGTQPTVPPQATVPPAQPAPASGSAATCASTATLTLVSDRTAVWPGATVTFTATLANTGKRPLREIVLDNVLASGLDPVSVISGEGQWQGRTLRINALSLDPTASLAAVYRARVSGASGQAIVARASATSAGCPRKTAAVTLGLPPSELPATGGSLH